MALVCIFFSIRSLNSRRIFVPEGVGEGLKCNKKSLNSGRVFVPEGGGESLKCNKKSLKSGRDFVPEGGVLSGVSPYLLIPWKQGGSFGWSVGLQQQPLIKHSPSVIP